MRIITTPRSEQGFTLIELSIVLVIIGLIVGGVLVGQDVITGAAVRAQVAQIEKYNTAVNTFRTKYGYIPGDIPDPYASQFGFQARGTGAGQGDGNGILEGMDCPGCGVGHYGLGQGSGENAVFWVDLSTAGFVDGKFSGASITTLPAADITGTNLNSYLPAAKFGSGNYVYAYSGSYWNGIWYMTGINYFGFAAISAIQGPSCCGRLVSTTPLTALQALSIDKKIDDGLPQSGNVIAQYLNSSATTNSPAWAAGGGVMGANGGAPYYGPTTAATTGSSTTCYDNGGNGGAEQYSTTQSGANLNCALSFKMQGTAR